MTIKIYEAYNKEKPQMFFGEGRGLQEFVDTPYPEFLKFKDKQRDQDWSHDEFNLNKDAQQLNESDQSTSHIFTSNLQSQIFADTVQGRGPASLLPWVSDPSLEAMLIEWSRSECLTPDHDVLTTEGWKSIDTITIDDKVAQYNPDTQAITFVNPSRTVSKPFKGNLIHFSSHNGYIDQLVTPNHRMPIMRPYDKNPKKAEAVLAKDVKLHGHTAIPNSGYIAGASQLTSLEQLYIAVQADGSLSSHRYNGVRAGTRAYKFKFRKERKINRLLSITQQLEYGSRIYKTADNYTLIYVDVPLEDYREDVKSFDWVDLSKVSSVWCEAFIEELTHWDGCRSNDMLRYTSSNRATIDFSCTIAHLAGFRAKVYVVPPTERWFPTENGERVLRQCGESYQVTFTKRQYACGNTIQKTEVPYDGMVYCLTVPDSAFMVRRNNKISLTFNCLHSRSYSHMLTSMYSNPKLVLDMIEKKPEIFARFNQCTQAYDDFFANPSKEGLVILIAAINILEGLAFYASFACNFSFANAGKFESVASFLTLIRRDEALHLAMTTTIIKNWKSGKDGKEWKELWHDSVPKVKEMYLDGLQGETVWNQYLFKYGTPIATLNAQVLDNYNEYQTHLRMKALGLTLKGGVTKDPLPWIDLKYVNQSNTSKAPQETQLTHYIKDPINHNTNIKDTSIFSITKPNKEKFNESFKLIW